MIAVAVQTPPRMRPCWERVSAGLDAARLAYVVMKNPPSVTRQAHCTAVLRALGEKRASWALRLEDDIVVPPNLLALLDAWIAREAFDIGWLYTWHDGYAPRGSQGVLVRGDRIGHLVRACEALLPTSMPQDSMLAHAAQLAGLRQARARPSVIEHLWDEPSTCAIGRARSAVRAT